MSQLITLELGALASEARRKHPDIKQAADVALAALKADSDAALQRCRNDSGPAEDNLLLRPILLSCHTKLPKLISLAMALLQRVVLQRSVPQATMAAIVSALHTLLQPINRSDVDVQLKILQIASAILSSYPATHAHLLSSTLLLCFKLQEGSKVAVVSSTAAATLRQSVMTVFDRVKDEDAVLDGIKAGGEDAAAAAPLAAMTVELPEGESVTLFPASKDAYLLFSDLCSLANGEAADFLALDSLSKTFSLELVESVLTNHARLFSTQLRTQGSNTHPELLYILRSKTCPLLIRALSETPSFPIHLRSMRLLFLLLRQFSADLVLEVEILMTMLLRFVRPSGREEAAFGSSTSLAGSGSQAGTHTWQRVLALEVTRSLCSDDVLLRNLWNWYDGGATPAASSDTTGNASSRVFALLVETLHSVVREGQGTFATEPSMVVGPLTQRSQQQQQHRRGPSLGSPRKSRIRDSVDRGYSGFYEAAVSAFGSADAAGSEVLTASSSPAIQIIDQLDKTEPPAVASAALPKTYLQLLTLQSLLFLSQSVVGYALPVYSKFVNQRPADASPAPSALRESDIDKLSSAADREGLKTSRAMLALAAPALRDVFGTFLQIRCSEGIFEDTLVAFRNLTNAVGALDLVEQRDALLDTLVVFALHLDPSSNDAAAGLERLSTLNLACLRTLAQIAYYLSGSLEAGWYPVVRCLCYAYSVLDSGLASAHDRTGSETVAEDADEEVSHDTTSTLTRTPFTSLGSRGGKDQLQLLSPADLRPAALKRQIEKVFENSTALDDEALRHFVAALCRHSNVDLGLQLPEDVSGVSRLPSSVSRTSIRSAAGLTDEKKNFPISSLGLVATLNVARLAKREPSLGWTAIFDHLHRVSAADHVLTSWRLQAADVAMAFAFASVTVEDEGLPEAERRRIQSQCLDVLARFGVLEQRRSAVADVEIRRKGLEALYRVLEARGHALRIGWETICDVCSVACERAPVSTSSATSAQTESALQKSCVALVKTAFSCVQIVCSDFLSTLTLAQLRGCISCLTEFGKQADDVNVALTANGCLWAVTAELATRASAAPNKTEGDAAPPPADEDKAASSLSELWLYLLHCLSQITRDPRAEVRNGAVSNLFRVLEQYGADLDPAFWQKALWEILFPVVKALDATAIQLDEDVGVSVSESDDRRAQAMGVAQSEPRQWDESRALALSSLGSVVREFLVSKLVHCDEFNDIWSTLLQQVKTSFLRGPPQISQASIKMLSTSLSTPHPAADAAPQAAHDRLVAAWKSAWQCWADIGASLHDRAAPRPEGERAPSRPYTQSNLLAYVETFWPIYRELRPTFDAAQAETVLDRLKTCIAYVDSPDSAADVDTLTPMQDAARKITKSLDAVPGLSSLRLNDLADHLLLAFTAAGNGDNAATAAAAASAATPAKQAPQLTFVALAKSCIADSFTFFESGPFDDVDLGIYTSGAVENLLSSVSIPVRLKYGCPPASRYAKGVRPLWQSASLALCRAVRRCCEVLARYGGSIGEEKSVALWKGVVDSLDAALSADCSAATERSIDQQEADERFDLCLLATIERDVLPVVGDETVPDNLIRQLGRAIVHASRPGTNLPSSEGSRAPNLGFNSDIVAENPRERFAYWCLDLAMLACSDRLEGTASRRRVAALMLPAVLDRCSSVFSSYTRDAALRGMSPMPRVREEELNFVLSSYLSLRLHRGSLAAALSDEPSKAVKQQDDEPHVPATPAGQLHATRHSTRAHIFAAYRSLCDLAHLSPAPGSIAVHAMAGSSLPAPAEVYERIDADLTSEGIQLGSVGARLERGGYGGIFVDQEAGGMLAASELARRALDVVAEELGL